MKQRTPTAREAFRTLSSTMEGLDDKEVQNRLVKYGSNEIEDKKRNPILKFLSYFWGPIPWMIEVAAVLSGIIGHWEDLGLILGLLLLNAGVGFWQEHKADNAIEALKRKLALNAKVKRNRRWKKIPAKELVPGDIVLIRLGDQVPADVILFKGSYLSIDESTLTGESLPVDKQIDKIAYSGSTVTQGEMEGIVFKTGMDTFFGKTAKLVEDARSKSHFQKAVMKIGDYLIAMALVLVGIVLVISLFRKENIIDTLQFALVLTVAGIPVALPAVLSVTLAVGAIALSKKDTIVSKLVSIEEMAGMDVLCSDKTGTITMNKLIVADLEAFKGHTKEEVSILSFLASKEEDADPIDTSIIEHFRMTVKDQDAFRGYKVLNIVPFNPVSKRMTVEVGTESGEKFFVSKGAPQSILELTGGAMDIENRVKHIVDRFASRGYRPLGVARTDKDGNWVYMGMLALNDPPRKDSAATIKKATSLGVKVKMITGDHIAIAKEMARRVGIGTKILGSRSLDESGPDIDNRIEEGDGFAQVYPEHKYRIVERLQSMGHIVGMTGDGVNDAPALKKADVGIAVSGATDAAKSAASIVLTRKGLGVIIDAIDESRKIFQRMNNYAIYRITETIRILLFITLAIIVFDFYPITALMIVLLALLNDAPIMTIAYDNVRSSPKPERWNI
ncbi:MAG: plasma-membrane proton-efflux P-type ATPase, partial [Candidatus Thermoplasmatota archaeon]|nr:plasma-membrane proton-efflux P-type ATPase [Candidatus Thermoplasmatota archaeon]